MTRMTRIVSLFLVLSLANLFMVNPALAMPPIPSSFYGTVKVNAANVADGTLVQALINGQVFAQGVTQTYQGSSVYSLDIPGDDTDTTVVDGGRDGDIIRFKIGGKLADQTGVWKSGTNVSLNLSRTSVPTQTPMPTPTKRPSNPYMKSKALTPFSMTTQFGTTSGSLSSLGLLDQNGAEDDPAAYVSFQTPNSFYSGYRTFTLPEDVRPLLVSTMLIQVNFKGPASSAQKWTWSIYDWNTKQWIKLGDSTGANAGQWQSLLFRVRHPWRYISAGGAIRIQLRSNNANGDAKVDYEAIHITYLSISATSTSAIPTVTPRRPGISSAPTGTPRP